MLFSQANRECGKGLLMMSRDPITFFIAGTDTGVGKTLIAAALLRAARADGVSTLGMKPLAVGCDETPQGKCSQDALLLREHSSIEVPSAMTNPVSLRLEVEPHIAAQQEGRRLDAGRLEGYCRAVLMQRAGLTLIEGIGGWHAPLNNRQTQADLAKLLRHPVILVVGLGPGGINHALLSARAILADGLSLAGWVANQIDRDMPFVQDHMDAIAQRLPAPFLGHVPPLHGLTDSERVAQAMSHLRLDALPGFASEHGN
jgi:dethiobiotin synthetase